MFKIDDNTAVNTNELLYREGNSIKSVSLVSLGSSIKTSLNNLEYWGNITEADKTIIEKMISRNIQQGDITNVGGLFYNGISYTTSSSSVDTNLTNGLLSSDGKFLNIPVASLDQSHKLFGEFFDPNGDGVARIHINEETGGKWGEYQGLLLETIKKQGFAKDVNSLVTLMRRGVLKAYNTYGMELKGWDGQTVPNLDTTGLTAAQTETVTNYSYPVGTEANSLKADLVQVHNFSPKVSGATSVDGNPIKLGSKDSTNTDLISQAEELINKGRKLFQNTLNKIGWTRESVLTFDAIIIVYSLSYMLLMLRKDIKEGVFRTPGHTTI